ncbi:MAG: hypothetical protein UX89_C0022G0014 [Parcubacteria group bacterium GW2011_GWA2_47_16]|nr:MAG: hypothetical protein UX89_C0022G0014 [Parcubacteria group bacterium GW2011_GWA2_47_16]
MNLKFSIHFQQAIIERDVSIDDLKKVIRNPDNSHSSFGGRQVAQKEVNGKMLEVVYTESITPSGKIEYTIITAYYILNK